MKYTFGLLGFATQVATQGYSNAFQKPGINDGELLLLL